MADNVYSVTGRPKNYKFDRGGVPAEMGPFVGEVMNNVDSIRSGRLQVYIEQFAGGDKNNTQLWRTVRYLPPFYGVTPTPPTGVAGDGAGTRIHTATVCGSHHQTLALEYFAFLLKATLCKDITLDVFLNLASIT